MGLSEKNVRKKAGEAMQKSKTLTKINGWIKKATDWIDLHPLIFISALSVIMALAVECMFRRSFIKGLVFAVTRPWFFVLSVAVMFFPYALSLLLKKRYIIIFFTTVVWIGFGVTACVLAGFRATPFSLNDILILKSVITIINVYLTWPEIIAILILILAALALFVVFAIVQKKRKPPYLKAGIATGVSAAVLAGSLLICMNSKSVAEDYAFSGDGYRKYGFAFSYILSAIDRGIEKPGEYSEEDMRKISEKLDEIKTNEVDPDVNIIMLQLESFVDVNQFRNLTFSSDPTPFFNSLKEQYPSGYLTVPALGAGTVNTEFEIISQISCKYFGIGETPYKSVMHNTTCETVNYDLKELGYTCHAIHNHQGTFYDRNLVYANLGFDTFTSLEYMNDVETNPIGWAKDKVLVNEITDCLDSTDGLDYIYAISVQGHGKYQNSGIVYDKVTEVTGGLDEDVVGGFNYYINQLREMDDFIRELTEALSGYKEKVVLVMYGDHYPNFDIEDEDLVNGNKFCTEYVIWSNCGITAESVDMDAYRLSSHLFDILGYNNGVLTKLHQNFYGNEEYLDTLWEIAYDMLYGEKYMTDGVDIYKPTELHMGYKDIMVDSVSKLGSAAFVSGNNFTEWSKVLIDGEYVDTIFINPSTLILKADDVPVNCVLTIEQVGADSVVLGTAKPFEIEDFGSEDIGDESRTDVSFDEE